MIEPVQSQKGGDGGVAAEGPRPAEGGNGKKRFPAPPRWKSLDPYGDLTPAESQTLYMASCTEEEGAPGLFEELARRWPEAMETAGGNGDLVDFVLMRMADRLRAGKAIDSPWGYFIHVLRDRAARMARCRPLDHLRPPDGLESSAIQAASALGEYGVAGFDEVLARRWPEAMNEADWNAGRIFKAVRWIQMWLESGGSISDPWGCLIGEIREPSPEPKGGGKKAIAPQKPAGEKTPPPPRLPLTEVVRLPWKDGATEQQEAIAEYLCGHRLDEFLGELASRWPTTLLLAKGSEAPIDRVLSQMHDRLRWGGAIEDPWGYFMERLDSAVALEAQYAQVRDRLGIAQ